MNENISLSQIIDAMMKDLIVAIQPTPEQKRQTYNMLLACDKAGISVQQFTTMMQEFDRLTKEGEK